MTQEVDRLLELLNRYSHGFAAVPILGALTECGCLDFIERSSAFSLQELARRYSCNTGPLAAALKMLLSLGWIRTAGPDVFVGTELLGDCRLIPPDIMEVYRLSFDELLLEDDNRLLDPWFRRCIEHWHSDHPLWPDFLDGPVLIPLLLALKRSGRMTLARTTEAERVGDILRLDLSTPVRRAIENLFLSKDWASRIESDLQLNRAGRFMVDRAFNTAALAAYKPMFLRSRELLTGDPRTVFVLDANSHETHLDRTMNVEGSGFQHEKYFAALESCVRPLFDTPDLSSQPKYIADVGCGDGSLLRRIYESIRVNSRRGRALEEFPLLLIAVDFNVEALAVTEKTLQGIAHISVVGDIGRPQDLLQALQRQGVEDTQRILHVRSFLDHDRPYLEPVGATADKRRSGSELQGVYVGKDGAAVAGADVLRSTVEHLERWSEIVTEHGLALLEVHCLPAEIAGAYIDECESLHFDLYHSLSRQLLLEAHAFYACAAEAGLHGGLLSGARFPANLPYCRISLNHFVKRPYRIRALGSADLPALMRMQCLKVHADLENDFETICDGQFVLCPEGGGAFAAVTSVRPRLAVSAAFDGRAPNQSSAFISSIRFMPGASLEYVTALLDFFERYNALRSDGSVIRNLAVCRAAVTEEGSRDREAMRTTQRQEGVTASVFPEIRSLLQSSVLRVDCDPRAAEQELGAFVTRWMLTLFQKLGVLRNPGETCATDELIRQTGIERRYAKWLTAVLRRMAHFGLLTIEGEYVATTAKGALAVLQNEAEEVQAFQRDFEVRAPECAAYMRLTFSCMERCLEVLTGQIDIAEVVFADGRMEVFQGIFCGDPVSEYFNSIVACAVTSAIRHWRPASSGQDELQPLRILEIGAGTGAATRAIVSAAAAYSMQISFTFSDKSSSFVRAARARFETHYPWMEFRTLDIESDLSTQGFDPGSFDIVIAANVLHDTRRVDATLGQVGQLLRPGGLLLVNEFTAPKDCLLFSGGLLQGYWHFEDDENRHPDCCLLSVSQWQSALTRSGFRPLHTFTLPGQSTGSDCSQCVLVGEFAGMAAEETAKQCVTAPAGFLGEVSAVNSDTVSAVERLIEADIQMILGPSRSATYGPDAPLMESGLDSIEMVELKTLLSRRFDVKLAPSFLFVNETQRKIALALADMGYGESPEVKVTPLAMGAFAKDFSVAKAPGGVVTASTRPSEIAIVGIACRFPGECRGAEEFWRLLESGGSGITQLPSGRWQWPRFIDLDERHAGIDRGGFLRRIDEFDAAFFRSSPREAELMDPQQRLMLELSWEAFEDSGHRASEFSGSRTGVFVGACHADYRDVLSNAECADAYLGTGTANSMLANRLSYFYDFKGPSATIDSACSSSLVALHDAVGAMIRGECEQALIGAVNLMCSPANTIAYYQAGMLSRSGHCRTFDERADGYVRGEGGAMLLLKRLDKALADRDAVYGIVKGSSFGHGGRATSLTAPRPDAQAAVIVDAFRQAGVTPDSVDYIEAHGTGTMLGDPVEVTGLTLAFRQMYEQAQLRWSDASRCRIGSVKPNIGHLEAAAGLAGLIKVLMSFRHRVIPGTLGFVRLNPQIDLAGSPFEVLAHNTPWPACTDGKAPRRAAVSSFGFGGANAHVILEEFTVPASPVADRSDEQLIPLSARTEEQLREYAYSLLQFLSSEITGHSAGGPPFRMRDLAFTLQVGREPMQQRAAFLAESPSDLIEALRTFAAGRPNHNTYGKWSLPQGTQSLSGLRAAAAAWVVGESIDWLRLHGEACPWRLHAPTYRFARNKYWIVAPEMVGGIPSRLHPLVHENSSGLSQHRFSSSFSGEEFFFKDHLLQGTRTLPAAALIEMARAAASYSLQTRAPFGGDSNPVTILRELTWLSPLTSGHPQFTRVDIDLAAEGVDALRFEIYSDVASGTSRRLHCQGIAEYWWRHEPPPALDLRRLQAASVRKMSGVEQCYQVSPVAGVEYGDTFQSIESIGTGSREDGSLFAIARLRLPDGLAGHSIGYVCHPSVLDGALQSAFWLYELTSERSRRANGPLLPFALETASVFAAGGASAYTIAWFATNSTATTPVFNLDVCAEDGTIIMTVRGLSARARSPDAAPLEGCRARSFRYGIESHRLRTQSPMYWAVVQQSLEVPRHSSPLCAPSVLMPV